MVLDRAAGRGQAAVARCGQLAGKQGGGEQGREIRGAQFYLKSGAAW
ncbi:hypothetical protein Hsero_1581 [Herbaspirillum seropedicae SmR1]|uniref:Uncharacterized protein n=1 Tax=Herbaspirillum seropedicae (strain SmR1) TaxID=757424 RepID=D8IQ48_HERSS|nr:hypothetical protein Hsero_1581 [Herbaspirillum seropedicae SmR1]